jgi:hypothetical protein
VCRHSDRQKRHCEKRAPFAGEACTEHVEGKQSPALLQAGIASMPKSRASRKDRFLNNPSAAAAMEGRPRHYALAWKSQHEATDQQTAPSATCFTLVRRWHDGSLQRRTGSRNEDG